MGVYAALVLMVLGGGIRVERTAQAASGEACPAVSEPGVQTLSIVQRARQKVHRSAAWVVLVDCLPDAQPAQSGANEIRLSLAALEKVLDVYGFSEDAAVDYVAFILAHEAEHLRLRHFDSCSSLDHELAADRAGAERARRGPAVLIDLLVADLEAFRSSGLVGDPVEASGCIELLEKSVRVHALVSHLAEGNRAHHYFESNAEMHEAVTRAYVLRQSIFDEILPRCEELTRRAPPDSCNDGRLEHLREHRRLHPEAPPASWRQGEGLVPWPRFMEARVVATVGTGFGAHWVQSTADRTRLARVGPRAGLSLVRNGAIRTRRVIAGGWGAHVGYQALLRAGEPVMHRCILGLEGESLRSLGRVAGGVSLLVGWGHDFRSDADVDGIAIAAGSIGAARLRRRLDLVLRVRYEALISGRDLRRTEEPGNGYAHGLDVSIALATYFGTQ